MSTQSADIYCCSGPLWCTDRGPYVCRGATPIRSWQVTRLPSAAALACLGLVAVLGATESVAHRPTVCGALHPVEAIDFDGNDNAQRDHRNRDQRLPRIFSPSAANTRGLSSPDLAPSASATGITIASNLRGIFLSL